MKRLAFLLAMLLTMAALTSAQQVRQSVQQVAGGLSSLVNIDVVELHWTADGSGNVPVTVIAGSAPMQGWRVISAEFSPGSPAPTANYNVILYDGQGVDLLSGTGANLSASIPSSVIGSPSAPPIYGTFSLNITGNAVAGAKGTVLIYFSPFNSIVSLGASSGGGGGAVSSVFGRVGAIIAVNGDYSFSQISGTVSNGQLANSSVTYNGQAVALGASGNVNSGAAAHSVALNEGNGSAIAGAAIGTAGRLLIDQGAGADPSFNAMSNDCTITSGGAITCTKVNGATPQVTYNGVTVSLGNSGTIGCAGGGVNAQTANYTLASADNGGLVTMNGSSLTATLANAPPSSKWCATILNLNSTALTVSRNTLQINGGTANITLLQYQSATFFTDGSNYFAGVPISAGTNISLTPSSNQMVVANTSPTPVATNTGSAAVLPYGPVFQFTDPTIPAFAWQNQGSASVANSGPSTTLTDPQTTGANVRSRLITAPATPYTIDAAFMLAINPASPSGDADMGLVLRESGTSKLITCGLVNTGGAFQFQFTKFTNDTTFSAYYNNNTNLFVGPVLWVRVANDGTNLTCGFSADGVDFVTYPTQLDTNFFTSGPNQVGFYMDYLGGTAFTAYVTILSWKQH